MKSRDVWYASAVGVGIGFILFYFLLPNDADCRDAYNRMESVVRCMEVPGCMFDADQMYLAKGASVFYHESCQEFEVKRQLRTQ